MKTICFGEILFDVFPDCEVLGGAPLNTAIHLSRLGAESIIVSSIANDERGIRALSAIDENGLSSCYISESSYPTGIADIKINRGNADYEFNNPCAWDDIKLGDDELKSLKDKGVDAIVFGSLALRSKENRNVLKALLCLGASEVLYDVNFRKRFYSRALIEEFASYSTILKFNEDEEMTISSLFNVEVEALPTFLLGQFSSLKLVMITRGDAGISLYSREKAYFQNAYKSCFVDSVGAGDSVNAAFLYFYLRGFSIEKTLEKCAELASVVVSSKGATSPYPDGFIDNFLR